MGIQLITSTTGEEMVMMSRAEYDALLAAVEEAFEDGADVATYDAAIAAMSPDEALPPSVSAMILKGSSPLRGFRKWREMSQQQLADGAGLTQGFLSDLETGRRSLTVDVAARLRLALGLPASWLTP